MSSDTDDPLYSGELRARANLTLRAILRTLLVLLSVATVAAAFGTATPTQLLVLCAAAAFVLALCFLQGRGYFFFCAHALVFGLIAMSIAIIALNGSVRSVGSATMVAAITLGGLFLGRRALIIAAILSVCSLGMLIHAENAGWLPVPNYRVTTAHWVIYSAIVIAVALVLTYMRTLLVEVVQRLRAELRERLIAETGGRQSEAKYAAVFSAAPDPIVIARERDSVQLEVNEAWIRSTGFTREQIIGRSALELGIWLDAAQRREVVAQVEANGAVDNYPVRFKIANGLVIHVLLSGIRVTLDGEPCIVWSWREVTELRRIQVQEQQMRAKFQGLFDISPEGIAVTRWKDAVLIEANDAALSQLGLARQDAIGHSVLKLRVGATREDNAAIFAQLDAHGRVVNRSTRFRRRDGGWLELLLSAVTLTLDDERCVVWSWRDITEHRQAEEELQNNRRLLETVIDAIPMSIFAKDLDSNYIMLNECMAQFFGSSKEEILHRHTSRLPLPGATRTKSLQDDAWVFKNLRSLDQPEVLLEDSGGKPIPFHSTKIPLFDDAGKLMGLLGVNRDISDDKRAQAALRDSEHRYRSLFQAAMDCILVISPAGAIIDINDFGCRSLGYTRDELIGGTFARILDETMLSRLLPRPPEVQAERRTLRAEQDVRAKDGSVRAVEFTAGPLPDGNILVVARDVTERRRNEKLLENIAKGVSSQTGAEFFRTLVLALCRELPAHMVFIGETVGGGDRVRTIACCVDGALVENFEYLLAGSPCILAMEKRGSVIHPQGVAEQFPEDTALAKRGVTGYAGTSLFDASGKAIGILVALTRKPIARKEFFVSMLEIFAARAAAEIERARSDATVRELNVSLERRVRERTAELEAANRDLDSFGYSVSHDLRSPLGALNGFAHLLRTREAERLSADGVHLLRQLETNATRMTSLVEGLLEFSRLGRKPVTRIAIPMAALVSEIIEELGAENRNRKIDFRIGAIADAYGDPVLLRQVWRNLIGNAVKYSRGRDPAMIEIGFNSATEEYFVRDNGAGFDMQYAGRLFGVFERLHSESEFEGTGIGLAIVQRVVNRHGGAVRGEGRLDSGATFRFTLPAR
jgi:PAS domain S-box-containing protein